MACDNLRVSDDPNARIGRTFQLGPSIASVSASAERRQRWVRLARAATAVAVVVAIGTFGYIELTDGRHSLVEAIYMTVISISTVGYGEVIPIDTDALRLFTMGLILIGGASVVYFLASVAAFIIEGDILFGFIRRRLEARLRRVEGHVIVAGLGRVGGHAFSEIHASRVPVVGIDKEHERLEALVARHGDRVLFAAGEAWDESVLRAVGIRRASTLIAALPDDRDNFLLAVTARQLNPDIRLLVRLVDPRNGDMFQDLAPEAVVHPPTSTGRRTANLLLRPGMVAFVDQLIAADSHRLEVLDFICGAVLGGHAVGDFPDRPDAPRLLGLAHRDQVAGLFRPPPEEEIAEGDTVFMLGRHRQLLRLRKSPSRAFEVAGSRAPPAREPSAERVIVVGAGDLGRSVAHAFVKAGSEVTVIDRDGSQLERCERDAGRVSLVVGDVFERGLLEQAGLASASALVTALPRLRDNLFLAAYARRVAPDLTLIARVADDVEAARLGSVGATVINQGRIGGVHLARLAIHPGLARFAEGLVASIDTSELLRSVRVRPTSPLVTRGLMVGDIQQATGVVVVGLRRRDGKPFRFQPPADARIKAQHELLVLGTEAQLGSLDPLIHSEGPRSAHSTHTAPAT